ncbi:hypothetical protein AAHB60_04175 [Pseudomonas aeruginosa]
MLAEPGAAVAGRRDRRGHLQNDTGLEAFEHSLLPAEAIAERAGLRYADAQVMINVIDQPFRSAGFIHRPTLKSRLPLTLTLVRRDDGGWDASLASRFGRERTLALAAAMAEALRPC